MTYLMVLLTFVQSVGDLSIWTINYVEIMTEDAQSIPGGQVTFLRDRGH